jgi:hypothetical protein
LPRRIRAARLFLAPSDMENHDNGHAEKLLPLLRARIRAFSSEVETGSRQENASNQESRACFDFIETK